MVLYLSTFFKSIDIISKLFDIKFNEMGNGPEIAGYTTSRYAILVDGEKCSEEYISKKVLKDLF